MSVHQKAVNVGRRTDPPPPRKRHKKLNYSHHVELFPHGAPVSQRQRHLCDDGVLHRDDRLKLPAKVQTLRLESTPTQKHYTKILKKKKETWHDLPFILNVGIFQVDVVGWENPLWTEGEQVNEKHLIPAALSFEHLSVLK